MKYEQVDMAIGGYFKELRLKKKKSLRDIAGILEVPNSLIYYYESGRTSIPKEVAKELLNYYGEDSDELLDVMSKAFTRSIFELYAFFNDYEPGQSIGWEKQDAGL